MNKKRTHHKTIVISDVHIGTTNSKSNELVRFLKHNSCDKLILNGDIFDGWRLRKSGKWKKKHTSLLKIFLKLIQKSKTHVVYVRGNHDDFLDVIIPLTFGNLSIKKDYIHVSNGKKYYVCHGDVFDAVTSNLRWLAQLGDLGYTLLLWINKIYNNWRLKRGLPYYSLSQAIKYKVKVAVSRISDFEKELVALTRSRKCEGVICGHIHHPSIQYFDDILYLNSGDWVESLSALVEDMYGNWKIIYYEDITEDKDQPETVTEEIVDEISEIVPVS
ncbi:MAG: UDP-2,3-diacylglucosamine hydrolase [Candidatus Schekmanbacteria bacterium RBG_13_48_7]|uniref:UDP-2,3-diacylglucosamine hydrolase n=1 Tax=Candidatus Schekmanbacteria bacterium RBG_13_48_7 TaxID=1817878 RepID=A0A1F7RL78_9BACT|nr:MAG: UDP-2,3-diacylglucosamine hydrolase [Candidatus Schekmanbacteria bacterium RBG_13_48_7]